MISTRLLGGVLIAVLLLGGGLGIWQQFRVFHLASDLQTERDKAVEAARVITEKNAEAERLAAALREQNAKVDELQVTAATLSLMSRNAVLRVQHEAAERRAAIDGAGAGPAEMNRWLADLF